jgi:hypothetical protein
VPADGGERLICEEAKARIAFSSSPPFINTEMGPLETEDSTIYFEEGGYMAKMAKKSFNSKVKRKQIIDLIKRAKDVKMNSQFEIEDITTEEDTIRKYKQRSITFFITASL